MKYILKSKLEDANCLIKGMSPLFCLVGDSSTIDAVHHPEIKLTVNTVKRSKIFQQEVASAALFVKMKATMREKNTDKKVLV